jgi:hypothetical protein
MKKEKIDYKKLKKGEITECFRKFVKELSPIIDKSEKKSREKSSMEMMLNLSALFNAIYGDNSIYVLANLIKLASDKVMVKSNFGFYASPEDLPEVPEEIKKVFESAYSGVGG